MHHTQGQGRLESVSRRTHMWDLNMDMSRRNSSDTLVAAAIFAQQ